jgi:ferredoxin-NADP reductase
MHLVYSVRTPTDVIYADELRQRADQDDGLRVTVVHTRQAPTGSSRAAHRLDATDLAALVWPAADDVLTFVCGPTGFVDAVSDALVELGHDAQTIRTERFG